jgi:hypothetical protein
MDSLFSLLTPLVIVQPRAVHASRAASSGKTALPGTHMSLYRCYFFNELDTITDWIALDCNTDAEAERSATVLFADRTFHHSIEVWDLGRRIFQLGRQAAQLH